MFIYWYNRRLYSHKNEQTLGMWNNMNESHKYIKWQKRDLNEYILWFQLSHVKKKKKTIVLEIPDSVYF